MHNAVVTVLKETNTQRARPTARKLSAPVHSITHSYINISVQKVTYLPVFAH